MTETFSASFHEETLSELSSPSRDLLVEYPEETATIQVFLRAGLSGSEGFCGFFGKSKVELLSRIKQWVIGTLCLPMGAWQEGTFLKRSWAPAYFLWHAQVQHVWVNMLCMRLA